MIKNHTLSFICVCLWGIWGCARPSDEWLKNRPTVVPATGLVFYQGKPINDAKVFFSTGNNSHSAYAVTDKDGRFKLTTFNTADGAVPGNHTVAISKVIIESDRPPNSDDSVVANITRHVLLPERYSDFKTSGLSAEVTTEGPNDFKFELSDQ